MTKVAITGASGFVGRHVLAELILHPVEIVVMTRDSSNLAGVDKNLRVVEIDIEKAGKDSYERLGRPDILIHLAWGGLPNYRSLHHTEIELPVQYQFLKTMVEAGLPSLVVTGTCFEYGMQSGALSEGMEALPDNPYGCAKNLLRQKLERLQRTINFNLNWLRLFYVYGEGQAKTALLPQLKAAIEHGDKVFNMSGGEQLRDYLPISEVARLIIEIALKRKNYGAVNICSGSPVSVRSLVEGWLAENGWNIQLNLGHYPYPDYEPMDFWGDRKRLDSILLDV